MQFRHPHPFLNTNTWQLGQFTACHISFESIYFIIRVKQTIYNFKRITYLLWIKKIINMSLMNKSHKNYVLLHKIILSNIFKVNLSKNLSEKWMSILS